MRIEKINKFEFKFLLKRNGFEGSKLNCVKDPRNHIKYNSNIKKYNLNNKI